jgi:hypothetical protein
MNIAEMISKLANTHNRRFTEIYIARVLEVDEDKKTCNVDVINSDKVDILESVQLNIDFDTKNAKNYVFPAIGSTVLVVYQESIGGVAFNYTKIDKYSLSANQNIKLDVITENILEIDREKISLETPSTQIKLEGKEIVLGVSDAGKAQSITVSPDSIKLGSPSSSQKVCSAKKVLTVLNRVIDDINTYKQNIIAWTPVPGDGGTSFKTIQTPWALQQLPTFLELDLETGSPILTD